MAEMPSFTKKALQQPIPKGFGSFSLHQTSMPLVSTNNLNTSKNSIRNTYRLFQKFSRFYNPKENGEHERYERTNQGNRREQ